MKRLRKQIIAILLKLEVTELASLHMFDPEHGLRWSLTKNKKS